MRVVERVEAHYEVQQVEMGTVYRWCPEIAVIDCDCGERLALSTSGTDCFMCGADHATLVGEVLEVAPVDKVATTPGACCAFTTSPLEAPREAKHERWTRTPLEESLRKSAGQIRVPSGASAIGNKGEQRQVRRCRSVMP